MMMTDEEKMKAGVGNAGTANNQAPNFVTETVKYQDGSSATGPAPLPKRSPEEQAADAAFDAQQSKSAVARFNEEPFIVAVKALLLKIDLEPKIGWEVEWQAIRRELKALEESMR